MPSFSNSLASRECFEKSGKRERFHPLIDSIMMKRQIQLTAAALLLFAFPTACQSDNDKAPAKKAEETKKETQPEAKKEVKLEKAYFASGCFWCVEAVYESVKGVKESISGYSGGHTENPTYESSNTGRTGHAEAVEIIYNPEVVSFATLVDVYFGSQNVAQVNGQGPDYGSQYRSIIFYKNDDQKKIIEEKITALQKTLPKGDEVAAEVMEFKKFWVGEDYHQDYEKLHPDDGYIMGVSIPRLKKFQAKFPQLLKEESKH